jgi:hypothetical protein
VPSLQEREAYDGGRGYELPDLEAAISNLDATILKTFRQSSCHDPVALQILKLDKLSSMSLTANSSSSTGPKPHPGRQRYPPPRKEQYSSTFPPRAKGGGGLREREEEIALLRKILSLNLRTFPLSLIRRDAWIWTLMLSIRRGACDARFTMQYEPKDALGVSRKGTFDPPARSPLVPGKGISIREKSLFGSPSQNQNSLALNGTSLSSQRNLTCSLPLSMIK